MKKEKNEIDLKYENTLILQFALNFLKENKELKEVIEVVAENYEELLKRVIKLEKELKKGKR